MANIDLTALSKEELTQLQTDVRKAIKSFDDRKRMEALAALDAKAKELGFSFAELLSETKARKAANPPKYMHPEHPQRTWTGRGRQPAWIKEGLASGKSLEDFLIA